MRVGLTSFAIATALFSAPATAQSVMLGESEEIFTLYGLGPVSPGFGSFDVGQGSSSFDGSLATFILSGAITGGAPGFDSGTYQFVTTYAGADTPDAGPNAPTARTNAIQINQFNYLMLDPSTTITLYLYTAGADYVIPLFANNAFGPGVGFSFERTSDTCTGVDVCTQNNVGLTPGATIYGTVTTSVSWQNEVTLPPSGAVPEPATWAMMLLGFGAVGVSMRRRRRTVLQAA